MTSLASVFVEVRPDTSGFSSELKTSLAKTREAVDVAAKLDTSKLKPQLDALKAELKSITVTKASITADSAKASATIRALKEQLKTLNEAVKVNADDAEAKAKIAAIKAEIKSVQDAKAKINVDSTMASAHLKALQAQLSVFDGKDYTANVKVRGADGVNFAFRGVSNLTTAIAGLAPIAVPALASVAAGIGAVGSAAAAAGGAVGIWGGVMAGALANYKKDVQNLKTLNKSLQTATDPAKIAKINAQIANIKAGWSQDEKDFNNLKDKFLGAFQAIVKASGPATFGVLNSGMQLLIGLMPKAVPIINAVGSAVSGLISDVAKFSRTKEFQGILDWFRIQGPAAVTLFAHSAGNLLLGVFRLLQGFAPFQTSVLVGFEKMTRSFANWSAGFGQSSAFHQFMAYAAHILPEVRDLFVSLATFAGRFVTALAPIGNIELRVVTTFLDRLNQLPIGVLTAFAGTITAVVLGLKAWELAVKAMAVSDAVSKITGGLGKAMEDVRVRTLLAKDAFKQARTESGLLGSSMAGLKAGASEAGGAIKTAFRGAAGLAGIALLTTNTSKASTQVNALKDAAGAAAIGFSVAGPWGAAIGGAVGLLGGLFGASQKAKQAQKDLAAQATSTANSVAATLDKQTGAITRNTVETAKNALANTGVYDAAKTLGVNLNDLTSAYLGNAAAAGRVGQRILAVRDAQGGEVSMSAKSKAAWDKINDAVFATGGSFAATRRHIQEVNGVNATFAGNAGASVAASGKLTAAQGKLRAATQNLNTQIQNEINKFTILRGDHLSQSAAADAVSTSVHNLTTSLKTNSGIIQGNTTKALSNRQAIRDAASALNDKITADFKANSSSKGVAKAMDIARVATEKGRQKLIDNITAVTGNRDAAKKYVDYLIKNPARLKVETPGMAEAQRQIGILRSDIIKLRGLNVSPGIAVKFSARAAAAAAHAASVHAQLPGHATGGPVFGAGTATSDSIPAMLSNNEHVWTAREVAAAGGHGAVEAIRASVLQGRGLALAAGGAVANVRTSGSGLSGTEAGISGYLLRSANAAQKAADAAAAAVAARFGNPGSGPGGHGTYGVARWAPDVLKVLAMFGLGRGWLAAGLHRISVESGGNPRAINLWDSNAKAGHPSQGLMQTIPSTFAAYAGPFRSRGIYDGLASIYAGVNYALHRYGVPFVGGNKGYANGGLVNGPGTGTSDSILARVSNGEYIVPARAVPANLDALDAISGYAAGGKVTAKRTTAAANRHRIVELGGATIRAIARGNGGSMDTVIKHLTELVKRDLKGRQERQLLRGVHGLSSIQARSAAIDARLAAAQHTRSSVLADRGAIRQAFVGFGPNLADYAQSPTGILGGLRAQLSSVRKFTSSIKQLRKLGYPNSIVSQVVGLGLTDGIAAAAQLIGLSKSDRRSVISTFGALKTTATGNGVALSNQMYRGAIKAADAQIKRLQTRQKHIDAVFEHAAEALAKRLARLLRIPVAKPKPVKATHDAGGWLGTGVQLTANYTGKPEAVYTHQQQTQMDEDRAMMRKLIARYESGQATGRMAPFIGSAVIRETVDLERYERQRAFRERSGNVSG